MKKQRGEPHSALARMLPESIRRRMEQRPGLTKILTNIGWLSVDKIFRLGIGLFVGVWVARYLGPEQFGLLNFALAFAGLFGAIATLGLQSIVVRDIVRQPDGAPLTLGTAAMLQSIAGVLSFGLILAAITYLRPDDQIVRSIVAIFATMMLFKGSDIALYWFESLVQFKYIVWIQNGAFFVSSIIKLTLIFNHASIISFAWIILLEVIFISLSSVLAMHHFGMPLPSLNITLERTKSLLKDSWPLLLSSAAITIYMKIDQIMLAEMIGEKSVGIFSAAARLSESWYFIPTMIATSVFPTIISNKANNKTLYLSRVQSLYDLLSFVSVSIAIFFSLFSTEIISTLYGANYSASVPVFAIQIWAGIFVSMGIARGKWLVTENYQSIGYWYITLAMVINIVGNLLLIPEYKEVGAAIATVISQATAAIVAPALFKETRISSIMLLKSLNPYRWIRLLKTLNKE